MNPPQFPMDTETASSPAESMSRDVVERLAPRDDDEFAELGVEELINKLPDVLFPFDGEADDGEELTPRLCMVPPHPAASSRASTRVATTGGSRARGRLAAGGPRRRPSGRSAPAQAARTGSAGANRPAVAFLLRGPRRVIRSTPAAGTRALRIDVSRRFVPVRFAPAHARRDTSRRGGGRGRAPSSGEEEPSPNRSTVRVRSVREVYVPVHEFPARRFRADGRDSGKIPSAALCEKPSSPCPEN